MAGSLKQARVVFGDGCTQSKEVSHSSIVTTTTTTTTQPTTTTTTIPPYPIGEKLSELRGKVAEARVWYNNKVVFGSHQSFAAGERHLAAYSRSFKAITDRAVAFGEATLAEYQAHTSMEQARLDELENTIAHARRWQSFAAAIRLWQTEEQNRDTEKRMNLGPEAGPINGKAHLFDVITDQGFQQRVRSLTGVSWWVGRSGGFSEATKRNLHRFVYYHAFTLLEELDGIITRLPTETGKGLATWYRNNRLRSQLSGSWSWLVKDYGPPS